MLSRKILPSLSYGQVASPALLRTSPSVADALRSFTSLQVKDYGGAGGLKTVNVRSLGSEYTGVFIDGVAVDNSQNMQIDLGRFSPFDFSSLALYTAPRPYTLQSAREYASASSVHLVASPGNGVSDEGLRARVRMGSMFTFQPSIRWGKALSPLVGSTLSATVLSSNGKYPFRQRKYRTDPLGHVAGYDTVMTRRSADIVSANLTARLDGKIPRLDGQWSVMAYGYGSDRGLPGPVVRRAEGVPKASDRQEDCSAFLQGTAMLSPLEGLSLALRFKGNFDYLRYHTDPVKDPQAMAADNRYRQAGGYASLSGAYVLSRSLTITGASDIQYNVMRSNMRGFVNPGRLSLWEAVGINYTYGDVLDLSGNMLYCMFSDTFAPTRDPGAFSKNNAVRHSVAPSLVLSYRPSFAGGLSLDAFARRSYRMPSFNDLYYTFIGNSSLKPERAWMYDVGFSYSVSPVRGTRVDIKSSLYHNRVSDKIVALPTANLFRWTMYNIGKVSVVGWDIRVSVTRDLGEGRPTLTGDVSYTFQRARDFTDPGRNTYGGQIPYIPVHSGNASVGAAWRGWGATLRAMASSQRFSTSVNLEEYRLSPYILLDAVITKGIEVGRGRTLELSLCLDNLTSSTYQIVPNYPMPPLTAMLQADFSF